MWGLLSQEDGAGGGSREGERATGWTERRRMGEKRVRRPRRLLGSRPRGLG